MPVPRVVLLLAAAAALWLSAAAVHAQRSDAFGESRYHPAIRYSRTAPANAVSVLNEQLERGAATLTFEPGGRGYLRSVLDAFGISPTSQMLVYSQTSLQASHISAANPRAVYFNDDVAVAWIRGAPLIEIAAQDARLGTVFYQLGQSDGPGPRLNRSETCLSCHLSWDTRAVPGVFALSTFPRVSDRDYANGGISDHREALDRRWGGWYVTGTKAPPRHMGNVPLIGPHAVGPEKMAPPPVFTTMADAPMMRGVGDYLTPHSDIAALLVFEHQLHAMNLMTRAAWEHRLVAGAEADGPVADDADPGLAPRVRQAVDELADYLLFVDEVPLGAITGASGFTEWFSAQGPKDAKGRSLRELQLKGRLMKYPLSYTIYSRAFDSMPPAVRRATYQRLGQVLTAAKPETRYSHLTPADRRDVLEILRATKADLPSALTPTAVAR